MSGSTPPYVGSLSYSTNLTSCQANARVPKVQRPLPTESDNTMLEIAGGIIIAILAIGAVIFAAVRWQEVINGILGFCALVALAYLAVEGLGMLSGHAQGV